VSHSKAEWILPTVSQPVAIATVADAVPLLGETRSLVARWLAGLKAMRIRGLMHCPLCRLKPGKMPSAHEIAFRVAPRINAAGRMESARAAVDLLLSNDNIHAENLAQQLESME
jgi:single-stranded-DNA-specific exonuclease